MLPMWHSCFILRHLLPLSLFKQDILQETEMAAKKVQSFYKEKHDFIVLYTGSSMEGLSLPYQSLSSKRELTENDILLQSDMDLMIEFKRKAGYCTQNDLILQDTGSGLYPGYAYLRYPQCGEGKEGAPSFYSNTDAAKESETFSIEVFQSPSPERHGPAHTIKVTSHPDLSRFYHNQSLAPEIDILFVIPCKDWPKTAKHWLHRFRKGNWPTKQTITEIVRTGCHLVPVPHSQSRWKSNEWRISFSVAELKLAKSLSSYQRQCYAYFKTIVKAFTKHIPTFYCKTVLFWVCEDIPQAWWQADTLLQGLTTLLDKLLHCLVSHTLPNYFIPENNLLHHIPQTIVQEEAKSVCELRQNPLKCLFKVMKTSQYLTAYSQCLPYVYEMHESLTSFRNGTIGIDTFNKTFSVWMGALFLSYLTGHRSHNGYEFAHTLSAYNRLVTMIETGVQDTPMQDSVKSITEMENLLFVSIQQVNREANVNSVEGCILSNDPEMRVFALLKQAEIFHHQSQRSIQKAENMMERANVVHGSKVQEYLSDNIQQDSALNEDIHNQLEMASVLIKHTKDIYKKVLEMCDFEENRSWQKINIFCKYANLLYQTDKEMQNAQGILEEIISQPPEDCEIVFHKEQYLTLDDNLRRHALAEIKSLNMHTRVYAYYLLVLVFVKSKKSVKAREALFTFEKFIQNGIPQYYYNLHTHSLFGHACIAVGDHEKAKDAFVLQNDKLPYPLKVNIAMIRACENEIEKNIAQD